VRDDRFRDRQQHEILRASTGLAIAYDGKHDTDPYEPPRTAKDQGTSHSRGATHLLAN
jgi:hypothetical protein